jgi:hypothetical protein
MTDQLIDCFVIYGLGALLLVLLAPGIILGVTAAGVVAFLYRRIIKPNGRHRE